MTGYRKRVCPACHGYGVKARHEKVCSLTGYCEPYLDMTQKCSVCKGTGLSKS